MYNKVGGDKMRLIVHCLGLSDKEIQTIKSIKSRASIRINTQNQLTTINACGIYDDLLEVIVAVTKFKNFEVHLS